MIAEDLAYTLSFWLYTETSIVIFIRKKRFLALPYQLSNFWELFFLYRLLFWFLDMCEVLSLSYLVYKQLELIFDDSSDWDHIHILSICLANLKISPYPFLDSYITNFFDRAVRGLPLLRWSLDTPSCLNLFKPW